MFISWIFCSKTVFIRSFPKSKLIFQISMKIPKLHLMLSDKMILLQKWISRELDFFYSSNLRVTMPDDDYKYYYFTDEIERSTYGHYTNEFVIRKMINIGIIPSYYVFCCHNKQWCSPELMNY